MRKLYFIISILILSCTSQKENKESVTLDDISISYIKLALKIGQYSPDYIDAYYGPEALKLKPLDSGSVKTFPAANLLNEVNILINQIEAIDTAGRDKLEKLRHEYLRSQISSVKTYIRIKDGQNYTFDQEALALYEARPPHFSAAHFDSLLTELDKILPGKGDVSARLEEFKKQFIIPKEKLDTVFKAAVAEARKRTMNQMLLPEEENFEIEYVTDKPWSGYNWFKGNAYSLIQINTDLPIYIDRAIDLACHEGYPGHHVYHLMLEKELVEKKGWMEYSVYPLFSPQAMISEGSANYGIEVAFPGNERIEFEKTVLFPLAGLDAKKAEQYYNIEGFTKKLSYAGNEAARGYLDGKMTKEEAVAWLNKYALMSVERAKQRISFIEKYRSYVINYNLGKDLVKSYIERKGGTDENPEKRWELFEDLISTPRTPSGLREQ